MTEEYFNYTEGLNKVQDRLQREPGRCFKFFASFYQSDVLLLQPRGQLGAVGEHLEQGCSESAVIVTPHPPQAAKPLGHLFITLQQHTDTPQEVF